MRLFVLVALLCTGVRATDDSDLPVYLRGLHWNNVETELRKDLRLSPHVLPLLYDLTLDVSVLGYDRAQKSTYNGFIRIVIKITAPVKEIELHSFMLSINQVDMQGWASTAPEPTDLNDGKFTIREDRETIVIPSRRVILPGEKVVLEIRYNGTARMDGGGFYESWNQRENTTAFPYISLQTHCEPTRARRWFPCFDEPDKKANFRLVVSHPEDTNAYSNTRILGTSSANGKRVTEFNHTVPLPTYLLALAITEQPVVELTVDGYEFRGIGFNRENAVKTAVEGLAILRNHSVFDGVPFIPGKTDILVVDDYSSGAMENPGLITYNMNRSETLSVHIHEWTHMYFGNLVTLSTWGDIWVNEGFAALFQYYYEPKTLFGLVSDGLVSLHDIPLHSERTYSTSIQIDKSFSSMGHIHYSRGSQVLRMIRKFVGAEVFDKAIKKYLLDNEYGNGDATKIINNLLNEYEGDRNQLKQMLYEWIYQPGVALLVMDRQEEQVVLHQTRFTSSYFDEELRDDETRFTIPLFCEIDGVQTTIVFDSGNQSLTIPLKSNSTFTIENDYGWLFGVWEQLKELPENLEQTYDWIILNENLVRSGMMSVEVFVETVSPFVGYSPVRKYFESRISGKKEETNVWEERESYCDELGILDFPLNGLMIRFYLIEGNLKALFCSSEARSRDRMIAWLHDKIITDELKIRSVQLTDVVESIEKLHPGVTMEFVMDTFENDPTNLPLRNRMREIIHAVYTSPADHLKMLHEFILLHPSVAAENYDAIVQTLEKIYVLKEYERKDEELKKTIREMLGNTRVDIESDTEFTPFERRVDSFHDLM